MIMLSALFTIIGGAALGTLLGRNGIARTWINFVLLFVGILGFLVGGVLFNA